MSLLVYIMHLDVFEHYFNIENLNQSSVKDSNFGIKLNANVMVNTETEFLVFQEKIN